MNEDEDKDQELEVVKQHVAQLSEHFDSVQIFCTRHVNNDVGTVHIHYGAGNFFARYGQIKSWLLKTDEGEKS